MCCLSGFKNSKDMLLYLFLLLSHIIGLTAGDTISPDQDEVSGREGRSVTLKCNYQTDASGADLYWYKHHSDLQAPQFILYKGAKSWSGGEHIPDKRYKSKTTDSSTELTITGLTLADTALYYCALEHIRRGALTFGKAITLTVTPKESSPVDPVLFILSPLVPEGATSSSSGPDVCLATGFRPKEGNMVLNVTGNTKTINTRNAALSTKEKTYYYVGYSDETINSCSLFKMIESRKDKNKGATTARPTARPTATPTATSANCTEESDTSIHPEKAKLNFYLVVMNGVRVVFTKVLAFNTILTIRAVLF